MTGILGIDIGGANIKAAHTNGAAGSIPFALWKNPAGLTACLGQLIAGMDPHNAIAVTMTGELCDCYANRREGVAAILDSVEKSAGDKPVRIWSNDGTFLTLEQARKVPLTICSANWLALATWAGRLIPDKDALLIDMGTTTTDIIPLSGGRPIPRGRTDSQRLKTGELLYIGWRRTPVSAILDLSGHLTAELFATTHDVNLLLKTVAEDAEDRDTADGRPATREYAHCRLARMLGEDGETVGVRETEELARKVFLTMETFLVEAIQSVSEAFSHGGAGNKAQAYLLAGSGEAVLRECLGQPQLAVSTSLAERLGPTVSESACAHAIAVLASEEMVGVKG